MNLIQKYTKKRTDVEAIMVGDDSDTLSNIAGWLDQNSPEHYFRIFGNGFLPLDSLNDEPCIEIDKTETGTQKARVGDYIVLGADGYFTVCHGSDFYDEYSRGITAESEIAKICAIVTGHCPREICTTVEAVEWLVDRHKAATAANLKLDEIRTEKLATRGLAEEANAVSAARLILRKSKRIADEMADGTPERPAENAGSDAPGAVEKP